MSGLREAIQGFADELQREADEYAAAMAGWNKVVAAKEVAVGLRMLLAAHEAPSEPEGETGDCGHPNHGADDHACRPFLTQPTPAGGLTEEEREALFDAWIDNDVTLGIAWLTPAVERIVAAHDAQVRADERRRCVEAIEAAAREHSDRGDETIASGCRIAATTLLRATQGSRDEGET